MPFAEGRGTCFSVSPLLPLVRPDAGSLKNVSKSSCGGLQEKHKQQKRGSYGPDEPSFSATALLSGTEVAHASRLGHVSSLYIRKCRPPHIKEWSWSDTLEGWLTEGFEGSGMT